MTSPADKATLDEARRQELLNQAMVTAAVLQSLVEQVRITTRDLIDALQAGDSRGGEGGP